MIDFFVRGTPVPQGSGMVPNGHGGVFAPRNTRVRPWREAIRSEAQRAIPEPLTAGVAVTVTFGLQRPKGHYRTGRHASQLRPGAPSRPVGKPDADKLARAVLDGLTDGGAWKDDSQVVSLTVYKRYAEAGNPPGCLISIEEDQ